MSLRLLVVDDSLIMRKTIQRVMEISDLPVSVCLTAEDGKAALSLLRNQQVDLILLDLNMPEMSGQELVQQLKTESGEHQVPFIVMSADATATRMQEMLSLGALAYIPKPVDPRLLCSEMSKVLENIC